MSADSSGNRPAPGGGDTPAAMLRILFLEDVRTDMELIKRAVKNAGIAFISRWVDNREDFLEALDDFAPDIVLSDYMMPRFTGMEALEIVKERFPTIPLIIITGSMNEETAAECMKAGAADYVIKERLGRLGLAVQAAIEKKKIAQQKESAEQALWTAAREWRATFDGIDDAVCLADLDGKVLRANTALRALLRKDWEAIIGHSCWDLLSHASVPVEPALMPQMLKRQDRIATTIEAGGRWFDVALDPVADEMGAIVAGVIILSDVTERKRAEQRIEHLNRVLRAIRGVNQLITKENDPARLLKGCCDTLVESRGYVHAWIALCDEEGRFFSATQSGAGEQFGAFVEQLTSGDPPLCIQRAVEQPMLVVIEHPEHECRPCPLATRHRACQGMAMRLEIEGRVYGVLCASSPAHVQLDQEERSLFLEAAGDIAFALRSHEQDERRRQAEEDVESIARFPAENPNPVLRISREGVLLYANEASRPLLDAWQCQTAETVPEECLSKIEAAFRSGEVQRVEFECDGRAFALRYAPIREANYVNVYGLDITDSVEAEQARRRLELAVKHAAEAIIVTDPEGVIQYINPAFERITGYSRNEVIGRKPNILKSGKQAEEYYAGLWETISKGQVWSGRFTNVKKNGDLFEEDATVSPVFDASGRIINYVGVMRDVSEREQLERRLRQAQKMEAIGTLAGGIAHDFNNVLASIIGYSQMANEELPEDSPLHNDLDRVLDAANRARDLVRQILTFSRRVEEERSPVRLHLIVGEALKLLRPTLPATIEIREKIDKACGPVLADPTQMHQVVMNLCTNAYQAMRDSGGVLEVALAPFEVDEALSERHPQLGEGDYVRLTVSDTGAGMDKETLERVFEPFFTTKGAREGTGLGLATVHGIVSSHGGEITVYSEPGKGATFHVYLPCAESVEIKEASEQEGDITGSERVLLIEDEEALARVMERTLKRYGYEVVCMTDSVEALAAFRNHPDFFDLVLTDQTMPKLTGDQLAREVMRIKRDVPVILTTGFSDTVSAEKAKEIGIRAYLMKPVSPPDLARAIRNALNEPADAKAAP